MVNTNIAPISVANVSVLLSVEGGYTCPYALAASVPNSGGTVVAPPAGLQSTTAHVKVAAISNVFFYISNANFTTQ